ncbi:serum response factor-like isoform X1 [Clavelina lepadiformis]|uniref:serum response factor-like isoform X1 n=1 Tax=Clavelina lepadiformis TaxID=159417 RepID=UPI0040438D6D
MENMKRSRLVAGLDDVELPNRDDQLDSDDSNVTDDRSSQGSRSDTALPKTGKKTRGRVKINMEFIDNKLRRYTTFSKRKSGIMKKAHELATLTGTQVMLLVASETGHVYTFATRKLQPILSSEAGKQLIQTCLNSPDPNESTTSQQDDQRMSAQGFEEPELSYVPPDDTKEGLLQKTYHILNAISAQQHDSPPRRDNDQSSSAPVNLVAMSNANMENHRKSTAVHFPTSQSYTIMPAQSGSPQLDHHHLHLASSSPAVRMQMVPVSHDSPPPNSMPPSSVTNPHAHNLARTMDDGRLALLNPYSSMPRPVPGVQPLLVAGSGSLQLPTATQVAVLGHNQKKTSR